MIRKYVQGAYVERSDTDNEMYCAIGRFAINEDVHAALGVPITGRDGDAWIFTLEKNTPVGFTQLRMAQNGVCHIRYLHAANDKQSVTLAKSAIATAREMGAKTIYTNDRESATLWERLGFHLKHVHHGTFGKWERELK